MRIEYSLAYYASLLVSAFLQELRSQSIYRIAGGYVVTAWLILQVASTISAALALPGWSLKVVLAVLLVGFGIALAIGWKLDRRRAHMQKPSAKLHFLVWPVVVLFVAGGMILIFSTIIEANQLGNSQVSQQADKRPAATSGSTTITPIPPIVDLRGGIQLVVREEQTLLNDKDLGLRDIGGKGVVVFEQKPDHLQFLTQVGNDTYLVTGKDFKNLTSGSKVFGPGAPGEFDNGGAGVGSIVRFDNKIYAFYEGRDYEGDLPTAHTMGVKGMYCSIGVAESDDKGISWTKKGQVIKSAKPKEWADWGTQSIRGAGSPAAVIDPSGRYVFLYYTAFSGMTGGYAQICMARSELSKGPPLPGNWEKFYNGTFSEAGIGGKETAIVDSHAEHAATLNAHVIYSNRLKEYILTFNVNRLAEVDGGLPPTKSGIYIELSDDGIKWPGPAKIVHAYAMREIGVSISIEPTIVLDSEDGLAGWLLYAYTPKYTNGTLAGTPLYLVGRRIEFHSVAFQTDPIAKKAAQQ